MGLQRARACDRSFNPRTPAGCDHPYDGSYCLFYEVSIHAPLRGATWVWGLHSGHGSGFNPRTPAGCDGHLYTSRRSPSWSFNPRTPAGCDHTLSGIFEYAGVSIHAPLRGATQMESLRRQAYREFQSTHPCGVRLDPRTRVGCYDLSFNPRTPAGCDVAAAAVKAIDQKSFNPRTPAGCD